MEQSLVERVGRGEWLDLAAVIVVSMLRPSRYSSGTNPGWPQNAE